MKASLVVCALLQLILACIVQAGQIDSCPVTKRTTPAKSVHDLHPSDIEVVAAIGDSVTTAMAARNVEREFITLDDFVRLLDVSFSIGGGPGQDTIPNFIKHYSPKVEGAARGERPFKICPDTYFCTGVDHDESVDHFSAASPAAYSLNLTDQAQYLAKRMGRGTPLENKYKLITVYLGQNDAAVSCYPQYNLINFSKNIEDGLNYMANNFKNTFVNLISLVHPEKMITITDKEPGYRKKFKDSKIDIHDYECYCCHVPVLGKLVVATSVPLMNAALERLAKQYKSSDSFVVVYQPFDPNLDTFPAKALSNVDGFHPSILGHQFQAKTYWNNLFLPSDKKLHNHPFDTNLTVYCPSENDRFQTM